MTEKKETYFILNYMSEVEAVAEEILTSKHHMIELDKKDKRAERLSGLFMIMLVQLRSRGLSISCLLICFIILRTSLCRHLIKSVRFSVRPPSVCPFNITCPGFFFSVTQSVSYFTHREHFGKGCAMTFNQVS